MVIEVKQSEGSVQKQARSKLIFNFEEQSVLGAACLNVQPLHDGYLVLSLAERT